MVSSAVGYAAAAMGHLASHQNGPIRVRALAEAIGAPAPYLSKIVHSLARKGFFEATRGKGGGVVLGADPRKVTLYDLCVAMDDDILHPSCALGTAECSDDRACPAHALQVTIRERQIEFLKGTTVQQVGAFNAARDDAHTATKAVKTSSRKGARK